MTSKRKINGKSSSKIKQFLKAIKDEDIMSIEILASSDHSDMDVSPLHLIIGGANESFAVNCVRYLLQNGADPNTTAPGGITPVHVASAWNRVSVLHLLLSAGGDPWKQDDDLRNAFNYAFEEQAWLAIELLHKFQLTRTSASFNNAKVSKTMGKVVEMRAVSTQTDPKQPVELFETKLTYPVTYGWNSTEKKQEEHCNLQKPSLSFPKIRTNFQTALFVEPHFPCDEVQLNKSPFEKSLRKFSPIKSSPVKSPDTESKSKLFVELSEAVKRRAIRISGVEPFETSIDTPSKKSDNSFVTCSEGKNDSSPDIITSSLSNLRLKTDMADESAKLNVSSKEGGSSCDSDWLRAELLACGKATGPITCTTKKFYKKRLNKLTSAKLKSPKIVVKKSPKASAKKSPRIAIKRKCTFPVPNGNKFEKLRVYSMELEQSLKSDSNLKLLSSDWSHLETEVTKSFSQSDRKQRGGTYKTSFNYLLLDSRLTLDLPGRHQDMPKLNVWKIFLSAIFYVGKGTSSRPFAHLHQALQYWTNQKKPLNDAKLAQILEIWQNGFGIVCLHVFHNIVQTEALTREAAMLDALTLRTVQNKKRGEYYGPAKLWSINRKKQLGSALLYKAFNIFLHEGERQIRPCDIS